MQTAEVAAVHQRPYMDEAVAAEAHNWNFTVIGSRECMATAAAFTIRRLETPVATGCVIGYGFTGVDKDQNARIVVLLQ